MFKPENVITNKEVDSLCVSRHLIEKVTEYTYREYLSAIHTLMDSLQYGYVQDLPDDLIRVFLTDENGYYIIQMKHDKEKCRDVFEVSKFLKDCLNFVNDNKDKMENENV